MEACNSRNVRKSMYAMQKKLEWEKQQISSKGETYVLQKVFMQSVTDENCNLFSISKYGLKGDKWTKIGKLLSSLTL
jgi:hypothetical protein